MADNITDTTRLLLADAIHRRLANNKLTVPELDIYVKQYVGNVEMNEIREAMNKLCTDVCQQHFTEFSNMINSLQISPESLHASLDRVLSGVFVDQINWGRITTVVAFSAILSEHCVRQEMPQMVLRIIEWTVQFFDTRLHCWISEHNGWRGLLGFCGTSVPKAVQWQSIMGACSQAAARFLGTVTLAALTAHKV